ncbi:LysR family transcriptional regulator substrate-binding protein [Rothia sp. P7181]|uniref:LysR family transcriptional regulator substrate-binding protein n=1 Tax=Rothia sp. P7181 TaxID=3402663 RepID=UPI003AE465DD
MTAHTSENHTETGSYAHEQQLELLAHLKDQEHPLELKDEGQELRIGYVPGIMPGKWFSRWQERYGKLCPLKELALKEDATRESLEGEPPLAHMVLTRVAAHQNPFEKDQFHAITLYCEKNVVVLPTDHVLTLLEEIPIAELAEETLLQQAHTVPEWEEISEPYRPQTEQKLPLMRNTSDAIELVAAGLGLLIVPMSIARLHHRKDLTYRVIPDIKETPVQLVWKRYNREDHEEQIIQDFVGITRGRKENSARSSQSVAAQAEQKRREKAREKHKKRVANAKREQQDRKKRRQRRRP